MNEFLNCFIGIMIPFIGTTLGASVVLLMKNQVSNRFQKMFLGFAAGVMFAASIWSLIIPSIEMSEEQGKMGWMPAVVGIILGTVFLLLTEIFQDKIQRSNFNMSKSSKKNRMLNL